jgi:hypothetical protein
MKLTAKKLKQLIKEELSEMMPPPEYRFDDEDKVEKVYGSGEFKDHSVHGAAVSDLMQMLGVNPDKLIDLRNRLQGMRLDQKGEGVLAYLEDITKGMDEPMYEGKDKSNSLAEKTANMNNVELKDAYRNKKKIKQIADELGVSEKAVKGKIASELKGRGKL